MIYETENTDIWTFPADLRCIPTNGVLNGDKLVMGAGLALQAKQRYPDLPEILGKKIFVCGNVPCIVGEHNIASFPTKHHFKDPSDIDLIAESAIRLKKLVTQMDFKTVVLPKVGCGLGGLDWKLVSFILENLLDDRFIALGERPQNAFYGSAYREGKKKAS